MLILDSCRFFHMFQVIASKVAYFVSWLCGTGFPVKTN